MALVAKVTIPRDAESTRIVGAIDGRRVIMQKMSGGYAFYIMDLQTMVCTPADAMNMVLDSPQCRPWNDCSSGPYLHIGNEQCKYRFLKHDGTILEMRGKTKEPRELRPNVGRTTIRQMDHDMMAYIMDGAEVAVVRHSTGGILMRFDIPAGSNIEACAYLHDTPSGKVFAYIESIGVRHMIVMRNLSNGTIFSLHITDNPPTCKWPRLYRVVSECKFVVAMHYGDSIDVYEYVLQ